MATKEKVLNTLAAQSGPVTLKQLAQFLGEPQGNFYTQLSRYAKVDPPLVELNDEKKWLITEAGRQEMEKEEDEAERPPAEVLRKSKEPVGVITEYEKFMQLGRQAQVTNQSLLKGTCDHVWAGDYHDLKYVHAALIQAGIPPDIAGRWTTFWGSYLKMSLTPEMEQVIKTAIDEKAGSKDNSSSRSGNSGNSYDIDPDTDLIIYMGEGLGTMTKPEALELSKIRSSSRGRANAAAAKSSSDPIDTALRIVDLVNAKKEEGGAVPGKSYMVKIGENGEAIVEEMEQGKPMVIQTGKPAVQGPEGVAKVTGQLNELTAFINALADAGMVQKPGAGTPGNGQAVKYIYVDADGNQQEATPGKPIIIRQAAPVAAPTGSSMVTLQGQDGKETTLRLADLETMLHIEDWKDRRRREEEAHQSRQDLVKEVKKVLPDVVQGAKDFFDSRKGGASGS